MSETTADPFGPEDYKTHSPGCVCPDCVAYAAEQYRDPDVDGCCHFRDPASCDECAEEKAHDLLIGYTVKMLDEAVRNAEIAVSSATASLRELAGSAYDIELAEGADGADALDDLAVAARLLRNVRRIVTERKRLLRED